MSGYAFGPGVATDLEGIWEHIAADDLDAADRMLDAFYTQFEYLAAFPRMGHARSDLARPRPLLFWPVGAYLIIYRADRQPIEIVAVTHASRDVPRFLRSRPA